MDQAYAARQTHFSPLCRELRLSCRDPRISLPVQYLVNSLSFLESGQPGVGEDILKVRIEKHLLFSSIIPRSGFFDQVEELSLHAGSQSDSGQECCERRLL